MRCPTTKKYCLLRFFVKLFTASKLINLNPTLLLQTNRIKQMHFLQLWRLNNISEKSILLIDFDILLEVVYKTITNKKKHHVKKWYSIFFVMDKLKTINYKPNIAWIQTKIWSCFRILMCGVGRYSHFDVLAFQYQKQIEYCRLHIRPSILNWAFEVSGKKREFMF